MPLLILLPLLGFIGGWHKQFKHPFGEAALLSSSALLIVLYFGGLAGLLQHTTWVTAALGVGMLFWSGRSLIDEVARNPYPPILLALTSVGFWIIHAESHYFFWDEYSHWGVYIKEMLFTGQYYGTYEYPSNAAVPHYFPGNSLWQYWFVALTHYTEGNVYFAHYIFLILPLLLIFDDLNLRQFVWFAYGVFIILVAVHNFGHGLINIYVDHILGAWYAGGIIILIKRGLSFKWIHLLPAIVLVLIKESGIIFAGSLFVWGVLLVYLEVSSKSLSAFLFQLTKKIILVSVLFLIVFLSWKWNRATYQISSGNLSTLGIVTSVVSGNVKVSEEKQRDQYSKFWDIISRLDLSKTVENRAYNEFNYNLLEKFDHPLRLSVLSFLFLYVFFVFILNSYGGSFHKMDTCVEMYFFIWILIYFGIILVSNVYVLHWDLYPSVLRYLHSGIMPLFLVLATKILPTMGRGLAKKHNIHMLFGCLIVCYFLFYERPHLNHSFVRQEIGGLRKNIAEDVISVKQKINFDSVWVYLPIKEKGFTSVLLKYEVGPNKIKIVKNVENYSPNDFLDSWKEFQWIWFPGGWSDSPTFLSLMPENQSLLYKLEFRDGDSFILIPN